jgi:hypothetical protein
MRRCEKKIDGIWTPTAFLDLKKGDVFRLFEDDDTLVDGDEETVATGDAYVSDGVDTIQCTNARIEALPSKGGK